MPKMPEHLVDPPGSNRTRKRLSLYKLRRGCHVRRAGRQQDRGEGQPAAHPIFKRLGEGENKDEAAVVEILEGIRVCPGHAPDRRHSSAHGDAGRYKLSIRNILPERRVVLHPLKA